MDKTVLKGLTMKGFRNILYVSNGIGEEDEAVKRALKLASDNHAKLSVFIACPPFPDYLQEYQKTYEDSLIAQMDKAICSAREALTISQEKIPVKIDLECVRAPAIHIIRHVLQNSHDLLIKDAEHSTGLKGFKALDMELLRKCPCALFLSKPFKHGQANARVAVAVDPNDEESEGKNLSLNLLEISHSLAKHFSGNLDIISCWHFPFEDYLRDNIWVKVPEHELKKMIHEEKERTMSQLKALMKEVNVSGEKHKIHLLKGKPEKQIPDFIDENKIDLLVMGTVARTGIKGFIIGNTAENILQELDCSLLALKPQGFISPVAPY